MKKMSFIIALLAAATVLSGCAVNRATATVDPSADFSALKTMHVVKIPEENAGIDQGLVELAHFFEHFGRGRGRFGLAVVLDDDHETHGSSPLSAGGDHPLL